MRFHVDRVPAHMTWELRHAVLRPHETIAQLALPDDDAPATGTFAAIDEDGAVVGASRVAPGEPPRSVDEHAPAGTQSWRLRGMATRADLRNLGIGRVVLDRAVQHVAEHGGGLLWCNARVPAVSLYRRAGFAVHGEQWHDPEIGPHVVMWRTVEPAADAPRGPAGA